jgi:4-oxalocrotonate tautomerase family enzyme
LLALHNFSRLHRQLTNKPAASQLYLQLGGGLSNLAAQAARSRVMAIVKVTILKGRDQAIKDRLVRGITEVMTREIDPDPSHIRVVIDEVEPGNYAVAGKTLAALGH